MGLLSEYKITRVSDAVVAGTDDEVASSSVDMSNSHNAAVFDILLGTITATGTATCKLQASSDDGSSDDWTDLAAPIVVAAAANSDSVVSLEIRRPAKRYIRAAVARATANVVIDGMICRQKSSGKQPVTHDTSALTTTVPNEPAES